MGSAAAEGGPVGFNVDVSDAAGDLFQFQFQTPLNASVFLTNYAGGPIYPGNGISSGSTFLYTLITPGCSSCGLFAYTDLVGSITPEVSGTPIPAALPLVRHRPRRIRSPRLAEEAEARHFCRGSLIATVELIAAGTFTSLTEQTYVTTCANLVMGGCPASDAFATGNLLSTTTFTSAGTSVTNLAGIPIDLSAPYVTTLVYTIVMPGDAYKDADASIDLSTSLLSPPGGNGAAPLPAALPLFATGLGALGLLGWRRKRRAQAVA